MIRGHDASGDRAADHELIGLFHTLLAVFVAQVAVVLLVRAVELQQSLVSALKMRGLTRQCLRDRAAKMATIALRDFGLRFALAFDILDHCNDPRNS